MIEDAIYGYVTTQASFTALAGTRLYPDKFPQDPTLPSVTYERISTPRDRTIDGYTYAYPRIQFNIIGESNKICREIAEVLEDILDNFRGDIGTERVGAIFLDDERGFYDTEGKNYGREMDFIIWHKPIP